MSKGVHNIAFYVSPDPEPSRTTQNSEISLAPSRGRILYAIYGNSTCVINHIVVTAIDKRYHNYYVSTATTSAGLYCWYEDRLYHSSTCQWSDMGPFNSLYSPLIALHGLHSSSRAA